MRLAACATCASLLVSLASQAPAATIRVPVDQPTIGAGVSAATTGDTVLVAAGTYTGHGNRDITFGGKDLVVRSESGPALTIIDCQGTFGDRHRAFEFVNGETPRARVEGLTIRNGTGGSLIGGEGPAGGGAIRCRFASPTISDCVFIANSGPHDHQGGAIFLSYSSSTITGCTFMNNSCRETVGGAISMESNLDPGLPGPTISRCTFTGNTAASGGAITSRVGALIIDCLFDKNAAVDAGAVFFESTPSDRPQLQLIHCEFSENTAHRAGALLVTGGSAPLVSACRFWRNTAWVGGGGALAVLAGASPVNVVQCDFVSNSAPPAGSRGGAIWLQSGALSLSWCTLSGNTSGGLGGAFVATRGSLSLDQCTVARNEAILGSGVFVEETPYPATVHFESSIVAFGSGGAAVECTPGASVTLACADLYGNAGGDWVGCVATQLGVDGNIAVDPLFCDSPAGDLRLRHDSPCTAPQLDPACGAFLGRSPGIECGTTGVPDAIGATSPWTPRNRPNPFSERTAIGFVLGRAGEVSIAIFDITGRCVRHLAEQVPSPGYHSVSWDRRDGSGNRAAAGIYFYLVRADGRNDRGKMTVLD